MMSRELRNEIRDAVAAWQATDEIELQHEKAAARKSVVSKHQYIYEWAKQYEVLECSTRCLISKASPSSTYDYRQAKDAQPNLQPASERVRPCPIEDLYDAIKEVHVAGNHCKSRTLHQKLVKRYGISIPEWVSIIDGVPRRQAGVGVGSGRCARQAWRRARRGGARRPARARTHAVRPSVLRARRGRGRGALGQRRGLQRLRDDAYAEALLLALADMGDALHAGSALSGPILWLWAASLAAAPWLRKREVRARTAALGAARCWRRTVLAVWPLTARRGGSRRRCCATARATRSRAAARTPRVTCASARRLPSKPQR